MRFARIAFAVILSTTLILSFCLSVYAAEEENMYVYCINVLYSPPAGSGLGTRERAFFDDPSSTGVYQFSLDGTIMEDQREFQLAGVNILGNTDSIDLWQQGYIYTFTYEIRVPNSSCPIPGSTLFTFGVASLFDDDTMDRYQALGDVTYTYITSANFVTFYVTSVVYVDSNFVGSQVGNLDNAYTSLEINIRDFNSVTLSVRLSNVKAQKAIGEDAYYQASVDALNDLNSSMNGVNNSVNQVNNSVNELNQSVQDLPQAQVDAEYNFILNTMPDDQGYIDTISGDLTIMHDYFVGKTDSLVFLLDYLESSRPCMYLPKVSIPFLRI